MTQTTSTWYEIWHPKSASYDPETFTNEKDAIAHAKKTRNKGNEYDAYWNDADNVVRKVTKIVEMVATIKKEDKIFS